MAGNINGANSFMECHHPRHTINAHKKRNDEDCRKDCADHQEMPAHKPRSGYKAQIYDPTFNHYKRNSGSSKKYHPNFTRETRR